MEPQRSVRALIVEDEPPARQTIKDFLQGEDWLKVIGETADGDRAVALIDDLRQVHEKSPGIVELNSAQRDLTRDLRIAG